MAAMGGQPTNSLHNQPLVKDPSGEEVTAATDGPETT